LSTSGGTFAANGSEKTEQSIEVVLLDEGEAAGGLLSIGALELLLSTPQGMVSV
jgi:hypothetical protein